MLTLNIQNSSSPLGLRDERPDRLLSVYPTPATDVLNIEIAVSQGESGLRLVDVTGKLMMSKKVLSTETKNLTLDVGGLAPGVYYLQLENGSGIATAKILKQ
jgi:hypothetical protein